MGPGHHLMKGNTLHGVELAARQAALGVSPRTLARMLGLNDATLERFKKSEGRGGRVPTPEHGRKIAETVHWWTTWQSRLVEDMCQDLEGQIEDARELAEAGEAALEEVVIRTWERDRDFWAADAEARDLRAPAQLHRAAAGRAAALIEEGYEVQVRILSHPTPESEGDHIPFPLT